MDETRRRGVTAGTGAGRWIVTAGVVRARILLRAPISGGACVIYQVRLSLLQRLREGARQGAVQVLAGSPFALIGGERMMLVNPRGATLAAWPARRWRVRRGRAPAADHRLEELYRRLGRPSPPRVIRARERLLLDGERIQIAGWLEEVIDPQGHPDSYRSPPRVPLVQARWLRPQK